MSKRVRKQIESRNLALELYDSCIRERQRRPSHEIPESKDALRKVGLKNFENQLDYFKSIILHLH